MSKLTGLFRAKPKEKETRYILSIDGGGMRGIIPAYIISMLDRLIKDSGDSRPLYSHFDLIAGTSTGALLSLGLSIPSPESGLKKEEADPVAVYESIRTGFFSKETLLKGFIMPNTDPSSLISIYLEDGLKIFPKNITSFIGQLFQTKYDIKPFEEFLDAKLGDAELASALVPTIAVSYDCRNARPFIFRSYGNSSFLAKEAARASTAAPLYFPPAILKERESNEELVLSDGGLVANNPSLIALIEAKKLYPHADEFKVLSLSTCKRKFSFDPSRITGATAWAANITSVYSHSQESLVNHEMLSLLGKNYIRIYSDILERRIALDDTSKESINALLDTARKAYENQKGEIGEIAMELAMKRTGDSVRLMKSMERNLIENKQA